ncbi:MAG: NAD(P)H-dependent oxidoreductase subunit E [Acidimicrobiia bacterium]|nr:NAD(P)H-dependent oxidoreductase subunit E [Acidimicrobiia bacterium]
MAFTSKNLERARTIVASYPRPKSAVLPLAHLAQDQDGWLSPEAMREIAVMTGIEPAEVLGTCSFYTMFKRDPVGRLVVSVCTNVTCLVTGGPEVLEHLVDRYSDDDEVFVEEVECLASCDGAPAMQVNYEFHDGLTTASAEGIIEAYKRGELVARGTSGGRLE